MTLGGSGNPIHPRRIGHPDPPKTQAPHQMAALLRECKFTPDSALPPAHTNCRHT
ncbi:hypothetical protein T4C_9978, partial [Trichinella pseudospiralis]